MRRLLCALLVASGCAACTSHSAPPSASAPPAPQVAQFTAGTCRLVAPDVLALGNLAWRLKGQANVPVADQTALRTHQRSLIQALPKANSVTRKPLQDLITTIGFVRIRVDGRSYQPVLLDDMARAQATLQSACLR